jgi:acyl-CoA synthetase (AMP-forming)/AMP-acid ligase II
VSALFNEGVGALFRLSHKVLPSSIVATDLSQNVTRSSLGPVALNIADLAEHAIDAVPDRVALISGGEQLTYAELEDKANRFAHYLLNQGVKKDDKVGLYCRNRIEIVIAMLGTIKAGAILVNVNFRYVEGELKYLFDNSDMVALVHERRYADRVANVLPETPDVKTVLVVEDGSEGPADDYLKYGGVEFEAALAQSSNERDFGERSQDDIYLLYTGGTTGFPKGVMWRHEDIYRVLFGGTDFATGEPIADEYDLSKQAAANAPMIRYPIPPMIHGATQSATWMALFSGQTVVLTPEFDADEVWKAIHEHKVNLLFFTGDAMARPLLDALLAHQEKENEYDLSSLFLLASTAALFSTSLKEKFLELLPNRIITDSIGSSETGFGGTSVVAKGQSHTGGPRVTIDKNTAVLDEDGNPVQPGSGVRGVIAKRGHIPVGYFKDEKKTAETFKTYHGVRYAIPGDFAEVDADGSVTMLGRGSVSINSGGEKIYPEEVEAALKGHPDVFDALVVGVPDPRFGQQVAAVVHPRDGVRPTLAELDAFVRTEIAGYKVPRSLWLVDEIKRSPAGKPDYRWAKDTTEERPADDVHSKHGHAKPAGVQA